MSKRSTKHLPSLFEKISKNTWKRLKASWDLGISQDETTITDIILLDLKAAQCPFLHLIKTPQNLESEQGTDWEWWIGADNVGWLRYAIQAKKIDLSSPSLIYKNLKHPVNEKLQLDILQSYASKNEAIGLYCFYNFVPSVKVKEDKHWHCNLPFDLTQLGCSIATLSTVSAAITTWGNRNFDFIHSQISTRPFRCLVSCPMILSVYAGATRLPESFKDYANAKRFPSLPPSIVKSLETGSFEGWDSDFYKNDISYRPKRILVAELPYWSERL